MSAPLPTREAPVIAQLGPEKAALLERLVEGLDARALSWISGYAAGLASVSSAPALSSPRPAPQARLTIVYGTQTGNSRLLAERLHARAEAAGLAVRTLSTGKYPLRELEKERLLYVAISTQGDGDPPDDARAFCDFVFGRRAPKLPDLRYSVLALGDSSYPKYCEIGRALDARLAELGAQRLCDRADCDVDFESAAATWLEAALDGAKKTLESEPARAPVTALRSVPAAPAHQRDAPYLAEVLANQRITGRGALKDVRHLELSLGDSGLAYEPGDSVGVWPRNPPEVVEEMLATLRLNRDQVVARDGRSLPLWKWLSEELEVTRVTRPFLAAHAALARSGELERVLAPEGAPALRELLTRHQVIDVLRAHPAEWTAPALVAALRRLTPRLYSVASSQKRIGAEVHLTVALVDYLAFGIRHFGAASAYLAMRRDGEDRVPVFIERNERFRLPADPSRDVLMIGPGTGVAPFRAFVQERAEVGATGRNWLFFGEQHFRTQFLYQVEWQEALKGGALHRISLAFSRDQAQKIYVQHRLREVGREVFDWLEGGAHLYVCGDAQRMAPDVHAALVDVISEHGHQSRENAEAYLEALRQQERYQRDVY
ncbi:MAG TPA: assimilatory sulfite reductase (NADPH) flavoprotein subunit [Myxococcaceae bacterium]|nr:assimilatory sulfite reductase (NADPH) flavoprotein subunit [Myxococcaceae bacterium]